MSDMRFVRGVCIGMIAGAAVGAAVMPKKKVVKNSFAGKAIRTASEVLNQVSDVLGI